MNASTASFFRLQRICMTVVAMGLAGLLAACGGGNDPPAAAPPPAAAITAQPTDQSAVAGTMATFSVTATNVTSYQWQRSSDGGATFADVAGAVSASLTTAATTLADSGARFRVVVSGAANSVTSSAATLSVTAAAVAPSISVQPAPQTITAGQSASFSVTAVGTNLAYQWEASFDGVSFGAAAGETNATLTVPPAPVSASGMRFRVVVSNSLSSVTSTAALLTVNAATAAAAITQQPTSQSVTVPATATFSAAASGTPAPTLRWQLSTNSGSSFADIAGATGTSYTTAATVVGDSGKQYRLIATSGASSATSNAATLTVNAAPVAPRFTTQPVSVTITAGQSTQFTVAATGTPTPTLQWQLSTDNGANFSNIVGATSAVFDVINAAQANNGRQFRAVASNSAGSVNSNAAVLTVTATPAGRAWGTAVLIETDNAGAAREPQIVSDASGNALAVWYQSDGIRYNIWSNRYTAGGGWGTAQLIEIEDLGNAYNPQIGMDASGNAIAVWEQYNGIKMNVRANRYTAGVGWGTTQTIASNNLQDQQNPKIAIEPGGNAIMVWHQREPLCYSVWANRYTAGNGWGTAQVIENNDTDMGGCDSVPNVAVDANGNGFAVWIQSTPTTPASIVANRYTAGAGWGTAQLIETDNISSASEPQIVFDASGNAIAVWYQNDGTRDNIWSNRYTAGVGWGTAQLIETENLGHAQFPRIAIDINGNAIAVWHQYDSTGFLFNIWANRYTAAGGWGTAQRIENDNTGTMRSPQIAFDAGGNALVVWHRSPTDGTNDNIWTNRYTVASGWGMTQVISSIAGHASRPQIAIDINGNAIAVWEEYDNTRINIMTNAYR